MKEWLLINYLSLTSFSGFVALYLINIKYTFPQWLARFPGPVYIPWSYILFLMLPVILSFVSLLWLKRMPKDESLKVRENEIVPVEGNFLPTYIGMYVIALSLSEEIEGALIAVFLFILWFKIGSVAYFNPFISLLGYRYYAVKSAGNKTITVITKDKDLKQAKQITNLVRINNYTFFKVIK